MKKFNIEQEVCLQEFAGFIARKRQKGFQILEQNDKFLFAILLKQRKKTNHLFNFLVCCFTLGLWSVVWIYFWFYNLKDHKFIISIDNNGEIYENEIA